MKDVCCSKQHVNKKKAWREKTHLQLIHSDLGTLVEWTKNLVL
jgi:hypothetical protein